MDAMHSIHITQSIRVMQYIHAIHSIPEHWILYIVLHG